MSESNSEHSLSGIHLVELSEKEFKRLSKFIMSEYGIKMPPEKRIMLQSRLQKRLKALNISNFKAYVDYVFSPAGQSEEVIHMMDVVSTNKTDFFREPIHFDFLLDSALPQLVNEENLRNIKVWSAGCSSGEEGYSIAMTICEFIEHNTSIDYQIIGSDISTKMLSTAANAVYPMEKTEDIPITLKHKYFLKSKDPKKNQVRVISSLRQKFTLYRQNLLELTPARTPEYHLIFCRNVLIYFDRQTQLDILTNLCTNLVEGGYLFLGHSESIIGFELPLKHQIPTVYRRT